MNASPSPVLHSLSLVLRCTMSEMQLLCTNKEKFSYYSIPKAAPSNPIQHCFPETEQN